MGLQYIIFIMPYKDMEKRKQYHSLYMEKYYKVPGNREYSRTESIRRNNELRIKVLTHYGLKCSCCGETIMEFLTIDHTNGGGTKQRKELGGNLNLLRWLINNDYPEEYSTMCFNCNCGKARNNNVCPHKVSTV